MGEIYNSPKVKVRYVHRQYNCTGTPDGFDAEFEVGWKHGDGHDRFRQELCALLDGLHEVNARWNARPSNVA